MTIAERALPAAEAKGLIVQTIEMLDTRAVALANLNRPIEAISSLMGVVALAERHNLQDPLLRAMINLGYALDPDDPEAAYRVSREGIAKARRWGQRFGLRYLLGNACDTATQIGDWEWVLEEVRDPIWEDADAAERIWLGSIEVEILAARGEPVAEPIAELATLAADFDDPQYRGQAEGAAWAGLMAAGEYREVLERGRASLAWGGQGAIDFAPWIVSRAALRLHDADAIREMLVVEAGARKGRRQSAHHAAMEGALASVEGRGPEARAHYVEALRLYREMSLWWLLANDGLDAIVADALEPAERQRVADEARAIFERLGAVPYLKQLDEALAGAGTAKVRPPGQPVRATDEVRTA